MRVSLSTLFAILLFLIICVPCHGREDSTRLYNSGVALAREGRYDEAADTFRRVIKVSPWYALGHYGLGKTFLYMPGHMDEAIDELRQAVELDRDLARGHFYLGLAYMFAGKYMPAVHSFDRAYQIDPAMIEALYNLAVAYDIMEKPYHARKWFVLYKQALKLRGKDTPF